MILLCDEDVGTGVPNALRAVGFIAHSLFSLGWQGWPDIDWLTQAGRNGWLVFSCNKRMLNVPREKETIIREKVGIVYFTTGEQSPANMLRVLLNKWETLELVHRTEPRPFARFLSPNGQLRAKYRQFALYS